MDQRGRNHQMLILSGVSFALKICSMRGVLLVRLDYMLARKSRDSRVLSKLIKLFFADHEAYIQQILASIISSSMMHREFLASIIFSMREPRDFSRMIYSNCHGFVLGTRCLLSFPFPFAWLWLFLLFVIGWPARLLSQNCRNNSISPFV